MMKKSRLRLFWSFDILKTEKWLSDMSCKGLVLHKIYFFGRIFVFKKMESTCLTFFIGYEKSSNGAPLNIIHDSAYKEILHNKNYYVLNVLHENGVYKPSHVGLLERNQKIKYVTGLFLMTQIIIIGIPILLILLSLIFGKASIEGSLDDGPLVIKIVQVIVGFLIMTLPFSVFGCSLYVYLKLGKSNDALSKNYGNDIELNFTTPKNKQLSKSTWKQLKMEKKLVKKRKVGWFYSPDKTEDWLESMEQKGLNLLCMSKLGNTFYFTKGISKKVKYHVDYQNKKNHDYFTINKESGWDLFFTSITRFFAVSVWGQEYEEVVPHFYNDKETMIKHARRFAISYASILIPIAILYMVLIAMMIRSAVNSTHVDLFSWYIFTPIIFLIVSVEFMVFGIRIISYYYRVKNAEID